MDPPRDQSSGRASHINHYLIAHFDELHQIAARCMDGENAGHSLQPTALMNEAVCQMLDPARKIDIKDGPHFLATARLIMQHLLIDRARHKGAQKSGGQMRRQPLHDDKAGDDQQFVEVLMLREQLQLLARHDPLAAQVIQKRCEGYSIEDAARVLGLSRTTAYDLWNVGRAFLLQMFNK